jgi:tetratricopeptide (TPR) repeat protein
MTDERMDAGRHHLRSGEEALARRDLEAGRDHFESAVLQFAGPDLKMGEGHALRGLASVAAGQRDLPRAEALLHDAIHCFRQVRSLLDALDDEGLAAGHRLDALEAEANTQVQLGEMLLRAGRAEEAVEARDWARAAFDGVGTRPSEAALWSLTARIALHQGALDESLVAARQALEIHTRSGDLRGVGLAQQAIGEALRLLGDLEGARAAQEVVLDVAGRVQDPVLEARTHAAIGLLEFQAERVDPAILAYERSLALAEEAGDQEGVGFAELNLGNIRSREGRGRPVQHFRRAVDRLTVAGARHGLGTTFLHAAEHALRIEQHELALALATGARRIWHTMDPVRGVSQALRVIIKALAPDAANAALLLVATVREDVSGDVHGHAGKVADYYRERVSPDELVRVEALPPVERMALADEYVATRLQPLLQRLELSLSDLTAPRTGLMLLDELGAVPPGGATDDGAYHTLSTADLLQGDER